MKLVLLGTTGYHPNERRHTACMFLPEVGVVLDAGTGMFRLPQHLTTKTLDIFLTHAHLDHVVGLTFLLGIAPRSKLERIAVHGEAEKLGAIREHLYTPLLFPVAPNFDLVPLRKEEPLLQSGKLTHFPLVHPGGTVGFRLDWPDRSLAYVTDTTATNACPYLEAIRGVDVLLHECYFADEQAELAAKTGHSHTSAVARLAKEAGVGTLVLVHIAPHSSERDPIGLAVANKIFEPTFLGEDGMEIDF
jgi:ribonuclease BN (tRNA processing enzyme)